MLLLSLRALQCCQIRCRNHLGTTDNLINPLEHATQLVYYIQLFLAAVESTTVLTSNDCWKVESVDKKTVFLELPFMIC